MTSTVKHLKCKRSMSESSPDSMPSLMQLLHAVHAFANLHVKMRWMLHVLLATAPLGATDLHEIVAHEPEYIAPQEPWGLA